MVKRVILGRSGEEKVVDLIKELGDRATAGNTRPAGTKVLDDDEDILWGRSDGREISVREVDEALEAAEGRIEEATAELAETQVRLEDAERTVTETDLKLTELGETTLPAVRAELEAVAEEAAQELAALDGKLGTAQQELETAKGNLTQLEADLAAEAGVREQLAQDVQGTFTELDDRLGSFATDAALAPIRQALTDAATAVETAQGVADAANQAANAASQAALEAAGIAASKGRVIIQATEPTGEDRQAANIWIKPAVDDPATEVKETATTYVYIVESDEWVPTTSDELAQAAQNALDAREAAQQAQQRADTAISNAATAQAAAEAAQRTADTATTDARDAWNEAVAAQARADGIRADMGQGPSLWEDPSFERGWGGLQDMSSYSGRIDRSQEWAASGEWSVKYTATGGGGNNYGKYLWVPVTPGRWYGVSATAYAPEHAQQWRGTWQTFDVYGGTVVRLVDTPVLTPGPGETVSGELYFQAQPGETYVRFWVGQAAAYNQAENTGQVIYLDDFRMVDVTESYPQYLAAQQAASAAQDRADEAMTEASEAKGLAQDAVREVGDTVRDTKIEYAVNTSETVAPTTGWSLSTPTRTAGSFIWMRTIVTYADGDTSTTSPALLTGNAGATGAKGSTGATGPKGDRGTDGVAGKDGVGLSSTALAYALSTSGTVAPTTGWTAAVPTPIKGRYLWTRTTWTYTDASTEVGYSVAYLATDGAKGTDGIAGKDGVGIKSTAITYAPSSSGTTAPTTGWVAQPPAAAAGQFVWTRTVWTYTDNSTETGYSVGKIGNTGSTGAKGDTGSTGPKGDTGSTGATGVGITSVTPFFRAVARTAGAPAQPTGMTPSGWVTAEPAWSAANKLYRAERVVYTSGAIAWTAPTLVASYEGIIQVQTSVNGKNSITRSTSNASGSGVVAGDAWYKVDGNGDTMAMWIWSGSAWVASKVKNEMIDTIDVNKLKVHNSLEVVGDAVIEKLWADGIAAKSITAQQLAIAPGNLVPDPRGTNPAVRATLGSASWSWNTDGWWENLSPTTGGTTNFNAFSLVPGISAYDLLEIEPGAHYRMSYDIWVNGTSTGSTGARGAYYWRKTDGTTGYSGEGTDGGDESDRTSVTSGAWVHVERTMVAPDNIVTGAFQFQLLGTPSNATIVRIKNPYVGKKAGAVLIQDGAVSADKINAESVGAAVGKFVKAEVGNLVATESISTPEAVIDKLWVDGLVGKTATFNRFVVAAANLAPRMTEQAADGWSLYGTATWIDSSHSSTGRAIQIKPESGKALNHSAGWVNGPIYPVQPGAKYQVEAKIGKVGTLANGGRYYLGLRGVTEAGAVVSYGPYAVSAEAAAASWGTVVGGEVTIPAGVRFARVYILLEGVLGTASSSSHFTIYDLSVKEKVGATLIEPGAISTTHLNVTGTMSAEIVGAMTVATKKLVVTQETILNHATLIGKTVVDDINVQGKLIGTGGVFTGTVDFANINVTGAAILNKIGANSISADKIAGGSFEGNFFTGGQFNGTSFIGATYATSSRPSSDGGVMIDPVNGLRTWNSAGKLTVQIHPDSGQIMLSDYLKAVNSTGRGVILIPTTSTGGGGLWFSHTTGGGATDAAIYRSGYDTNAREPLWIRGANGAGINVAGGVRAYNSAVEGDLGGYFYGDGVVANRFVHINPPTTSAGANALIASSPAGVLYKSTSSRRYKKNIADWNPEAKRVLALQPRQWQHDDPAFPENIDETWHVGFVAEEVDDLGLKRLVKYTGDGKGGWIPDGLNYDRFAAAQQIVLRKHEDEISELRERIALLESK